MKTLFFDGNPVDRVTRVITLIDFLKGTRQKGTKNNVNYEEFVNDVKNSC